MLGSAYLVRLFNSSTIVSHINTQKDINKVVKILGIKPSDSLSSDAVVFVEGITDAAVFRIFMEKIEAHENLSKRPIITFIPVDGWTKMAFTISVKILKSKFVRTNAYAIVDGDTVSQTKSFNKIQNSFESVFGHKSFLRLKDECLESIFLKYPSHIANVLKIKEKIVINKIKELKKSEKKDKEILKEILSEYIQENKIDKEKFVYSSLIASNIARKFEYEDIPDRIQKLFRKVLWDTNH